MQLWPDGEADEAVFDLIVLDEPPTQSALVQGLDELRRDELPVYQLK